MSIPKICIENLDSGSESEEEEVKELSMSPCKTPYDKSSLSPYSMSKSQIPKFALFRGAAVLEQK